MIDNRVELARSRRSSEIVVLVELEFLARQWFTGEIFNRFADDLAAVHENSPAISGEHDSVLTRVFDGHHDTISIFVRRTVIDGHIVAVLHRWKLGATVDLYRQRVDAPLGNVEMVCAPVGHLAAGIFKPPSKGVDERQLLAVNGRSGSGRAADSP